MTIRENLSELTLVNGDVTLIAPRMELTLYFDLAPAEVLRCLADAAMAQLDGYLTHYMTDTAQRGAARNAKSAEIFAHFFDRPRPKANYWIQFQGCHITKGVSGAELDISYQPHPPIPEDPQTVAAVVEKHYQSYEVRNRVFTPMIQSIHIAFPLDHPLAQPDALLAWIKDLDCVKQPSFVSGHAGFGIAAYETVGERPLQQQMNAALASALSRHPGLNFEKKGWVGVHLLKYWPGHPWFLPRIKRVNWLTFVRNLMLDELCSGTETVKTALAAQEGVVLHDLGDGLIIQAGDAPAIGDVTKGDTLPVYRHVAQVLASARIPQIKQIGRIFTNDIANAWLNALERDDD